MREKLTQSKENPGREDDVSTSPEEGCLRSPVPLGRIELPVGDDVDEGDVDGVVRIPREDDRLSTEPRRRDLGHDSVNHGTDGKVGGDAQEEHHRPGRPRLCRTWGHVDTHEAGDASSKKSSVKAGYKVDNDLRDKLTSARRA